MIAILCVLAGLGWLYALRDLKLLAAGPHVSGALPLQQLAGNADQPLARVLVAWLPAGLVAGWLLGRAVRSAVVTAVTVGVLAWVLLLFGGAASDAIAISDVVAHHVWAQLGRGGLWVATACMVTGSLVAAGSARPRRRGGDREASAPAAGESAAP